VKSSQAKNCFDDVLRMLREHEQAEAVAKNARDKTAEGLRHWKKRAEEAEEKLCALGAEGSSKVELLAEERQKVLAAFASIDRLRAIKS
jgi:hypothetical protein